MAEKQACPALPMIGFRCCNGFCKTSSLKRRCNSSLGGLKKSWNRTTYFPSLQQKPGDSEGNSVAAQCSQVRLMEPSEMAGASAGLPVRVQAVHVACVWSNRVLENAVNGKVWPQITHALESFRRFFPEVWLAPVVQDLHLALEALLNCFLENAVRGSEDPQAAHTCVVFFRDAADAVAAALVQARHTFVLLLQ